MSCSAIAKGKVATVMAAPEMQRPLTRNTISSSVIDIAHEHGAPFILDEVKTGFRTRGGASKLLQEHSGNPLVC